MKPYPQTPAPTRLPWRIVSGGASGHRAADGIAELIESAMNRYGELRRQRVKRHSLDHVRPVTHGYLSISGAAAIARRKDAKARAVAAIVAMRCGRG